MAGNEVLQRESAANKLASLPSKRVYEPIPCVLIVPEHNNVDFLN